ncbi:MAG: copper chaperone PCu(A)C [Pseudomonadota bacterium]
MKLKPLSRAVAICAFALATPALAGDTASVHVVDPYARASSPSAKAGAAFMVIMNPTDQTDRLVSATSDVSARVELHTHIDDGNGVMLMREVEDGFEIPAGGSYTLKRGGDHVMFMGLNRPLNQGDMVEVTLTFENAGDIAVEIPVDLNRAAEEAHGGHGDHGSHDG